MFLNIVIAVIAFNIGILFWAWWRAGEPKQYGDQESGYERGSHGE